MLRSIFWLGIVVTIITFLSSGKFTGRSRLRSGETKGSQHLPY